MEIDQVAKALARAKAEYDEIGVLVRGDGGGEFQNVASVLGAVRQAGISEMGISVRLARKPN